ncbi:MAG: hypothetical protein OXE55_06160 [Flavobacteriaceae bacterium]|nr:hypothetical protein [Flavobacteriaceae bacterium]
MSNKEVTNKEILEAVNRSNDRDKEILTRLENIENEVKGMNDKVNNNTNNIKWTIKLGGSIATIIIGGLITLFVVFINKL